MNTVLPAVTATCGLIFLTGGPTNAKLRLWSRRLNTGSNTADQVIRHCHQNRNKTDDSAYGNRKMLCVYFVWQEDSSSQELTWQRTWSTSAPTRQSRWRTWWCPRTRRCSAGWRSRRPAPESARSISSPGTLSQRATLCRPSSNWMRNYWNGPRDCPPWTCIILP